MSSRLKSGVAQKINGIDPLHYLPDALHESALGFLTWLDTVNDIEPRCCPYCGSTDFRGRQRYSGTARRIEYFCLSCERFFTTVTDSALKDLQQSHLWCAHMMLRFAGWSVPLIASHLRMNAATAARWSQVFAVEMERRASSLHDWWRSHQPPEDQAMPAAIAQQADEFLRWVDELAHTRGTDDNEPREHRKMKTRLPFLARLLLQGRSDQDIERELGIARYRFAGWRRELEDVIPARWPLLGSWSEWLRGRRYRAYRGRRRLEVGMTDNTDTTDTTDNPPLAALHRLASRSASRPR